MMLAPPYLTINQSEECPQADHALLRNTVRVLATPPRVGTQSCGHQLAVAPFAWQSNKAISFSLTPNSISEI